MNIKPMIPASLAALTLLGACGVDGYPQPPANEPETPSPGVTISGTASIGVVGGSGSISRTPRGSDSE